MPRNKDTQVTISVAALKTAFRKAFPDKTAVELLPEWTKFWAGVVLGGKVEVPIPNVKLPVPDVPPELTDDEEKP